MRLQVNGIEKAYNGRDVLAGISFDMPSQGRALLLGPSGSGKSTLLNIVCGLQSPDSGEVRLGDAVITSSAADAVRRRHMGIIFQTLRLVSALTVKANLTLAQRLQTGTTDAALVEQTLDRLGIADRAQARPYELSQGEAQRAAIARALVVKPDILIADEPTSALDQANTDTVAKLLLELAEEAEATLLIATHDDRLKPYFEQTLELKDGRLSA